MMVLRFCRPRSSNSRNAVAAARTASSMLPNTPSSPAGDGGGGAGAFDLVATVRSPRSETICWAMISISWSVRPATFHLVFFVFVGAADFPAIHDRHDDGVTGAVVGRDRLPG